MQGKSKQLGWLGLAVARSGDKEGLSVAGVLEGSPGHRVGIQPGDVLLEIDGEVISEPLVFESKVTQKAPGSLVKVALLRGGEVKTAEIEVGARPLLIARFPAPMRSEIRFYREFFTTVPDADVQALQENIQQLQRENDELRAHLVELEKRLHEIEKGRK
jgi:C-terminal processing protease CtpA/Prc